VQIDAVVGFWQSPQGWFLPGHVVALLESPLARFDAREWPTRDDVLPPERGERVGSDPNKAVFPKGRRELDDT
jgi:hypothetical protein